MDKIEEKIIEIFRILELKIGNLGYKYWIEIITMAINNNEILPIESLYYELAIRFNSDRNNIERALRTELRNKKENIQKYFNYNRKVTNKVFLYLMIEKIKKDLI